ncbi:hypothetical protein G6F52_014064 [Rhizopus delemar]|nr:hypothetical protein G6F52_014064 [Rhizopus delemar]
MVASRRFLPAARCSTANSTIRIAFFAARPITVIRPILKNRSLGRPRSIDRPSAPSTPSGTTSSTATGIDQLSYSAARHRNTTTIDSTSSRVAALPARISW